MAAEPGFKQELLEVLCVQMDLLWLGSDWPADR
jgi:hypothetical protein